MAMLLATANTATKIIVNLLLFDNRSKRRDNMHGAITYVYFLRFIMIKMAATLMKIVVTKKGVRNISILLNEWRCPTKATETL